MTFTSIQSAEQIKRIVQDKTAESLHLDFKTKIVWDGTTKRDVAHEFARDVAQFANTEGGALLVGVTEVRVGTHKVAGPLCSVEDADGLKKWLEDAIRNHLVPGTISHSIHPCVIDGSTVLVVNVPPSMDLVAVWNPKKCPAIEYLYRTSHGKAWMNPGEVERHLMKSTRATKLAVQEVFNTKNVGKQVTLVPVPVERRWTHVNRGGDGERVPIIWGSVSEDTPILDIRVIANLHEREVELRMPNRRSINVPYEYVNAAWVGSDDIAHLGLDVLIVCEDDQYRLEPLPR